jgi:hypothetical protein
MPDYKEKWLENSMNKDFWNEVLVGRSIASVRFDKNGIEGLKLDNGETIFLATGNELHSRLFIKVPVLPGENS